MLALTSSVETPYHRWTAGIKLLLVSIGEIVIYCLGTPLSLGVAVIAVGAAYLAASPRLLIEGLGLLRPLWPLVAIVAGWHFALSEFSSGICLALRIAASVGLATLMTMTTRLSDITDVLSKLLSPLRRLGVNTAVFGFAMSLMIRFIPVLLCKARSLGDAWRARSARRPGWQVICPLVLVAMDDAERVAEALKARGGLEFSAPPKPISR